MNPWELCSEGVTRRGEYQPCEKTAVAVRIDPEEGGWYPVCRKHTRADMVPLAKVLAEAIAHPAFTDGPKEAGRV